ncbi:hypothetical protein ACPYO6_01960 [Georgenia sp. Z1344]|uniref:hypothetical protein n=1 Tax=Georgenia sp. Z1344 TaxID=3416706 RepID=UPI003CF34B2C
MPLATITTDAATTGSRATRMLHRRPKTPMPWWSTAAVYETAELRTVAAIDDVAAHVPHVASLGCDTLLLTAPELDPRHRQVADAVGAVVRRAHRRALRVVASVLPIHPSDTDAAHLSRVGRWLALGVDGIDLGIARGTSDPGALGLDQADAAAPGTTTPTLVRHPRGADPGALQARLAERGSGDRPDAEAALTGAVRGLDLAAYTEVLHEDWLHATRDDRLARTSWDAPAVGETLAQVFGVHEPLGARPAWALATGRHPVPTPTWAHRPSPEENARRVRAMTALSIMLPGAVYLRQGIELGGQIAPEAGATGGGTSGTHSDDDAATGSLAALVAALAPDRHRDDSPYERLRAWLRLRRELGTASGYLGVLDVDVDALVLALDTRHLVLTLGPDPVAVPLNALVTHSSAGVLEEDGATVLEPGTAALLRIT